MFQFSIESYTHLYGRQFNNYFKKTFAIENPREESNYLKRNYNAYG